MKKVLDYIFLVIGGSAIGYFAYKLNTFVGILGFCFGICMLTYSIYKISQKDDCYVIDEKHQRERF